MTDIPQWAIDAARKAIAEQNSDESLSQVVARALAAEREAATMAERERWLGWVDAYTDKPLGKAEGWTEEQGEFFKTGQLDLAAALAAAIRAGE